MRSIIQAFAELAMERKLAENDGVKGEWRGDSPYALLDALEGEISELREALIAYYHEVNQRVAPAQRKYQAIRLAVLRDAVLSECADVALYPVMLADVVGALPKATDRGRVSAEPTARLASMSTLEAWELEH